MATTGSALGWRESPLWQALEGMRIEPEGSSLTFTRRLARENGWTLAFAEQVFGEYKRFLYLAATVEGSVTPSEEVDQAWHLHLTCTRHYWDQLCGEVLGRPLHHQPSEGGPSEAARYRHQYRYTLSRYRRVFGAEPPCAVWPDVERRFQTRSVRFDRARFWPVPKPKPGPLTLAGATLLLGACSVSGETAIDLVWIGASFLLAAYIVIGAIRQGGRGGGSASGCGAGGTGSNSCGGSDAGCGGGCGGCGG